MQNNPLTTEETIEIIKLLHENKVKEAELLFYLLSSEKQTDKNLWFETYKNIAAGIDKNELANLPQIVANIFGMT